MVPANRGHKMNIGIFGDSFAEDHLFATEIIHRLDVCNGWDNNVALCNAIRKKIPAWWDTLENFGHTVDTSMTQGGSDISFSFRNFITNHHRFDRNIFVVTQPSRVSVPYKKKKRQKQFDWVHGTNAEVCARKIRDYKKQKDPIGQEISEALFELHTKINYYNNSRDFIFANLMVEHMQKIRPDTLFINAFDNHTDILDTIPKTTTLYDIHLLENQKMGVSKISPTWNGMYDMRIAHMTPESSSILGNDIIKFLKTKKRKWLDFDTIKYERVNPKQKDWFVHESEIVPWIKDTLGIDIDQFIC